VRQPAAQLQQQTQSERDREQGRAGLPHYCGLQQHTSDRKGKEQTSTCSLCGCCV
jgi:hypothetical protein